MLLELADLLRGHISSLHLFQYLTFRAIMGALTALAVSLLAGPALIRKLAALKAGQVVRSDGPSIPSRASRSRWACAPRARSRA